MAEGEGNNIAKVLYIKDSGKIVTVVAVHIVGIYAADLIRECSIAELSMMVHVHTNLFGVLDKAFKKAIGMSAH